MKPPTLIRYLKLPYTYQVEKLVAEVASIQAEWIAHFNTYDYSGDWKALPLRSIGGKMDQIMAESAFDFADTPLMELCPYMKEIITTLPGNKLSARLLKLSKGAIIKEHRDRELAFEKGEVRLHVPIITHPDVEFWLDQERIYMQPGECWYINANLLHRVSNLSEVDRIHLVIDIEVTDEVKNVFSAVPETDKSVKEAEDKKEETIKMVSELLLNSDPRIQELGRKIAVENELYNLLDDNEITIA